MPDSVFAAQQLWPHGHRMPVQRWKFIAPYFDLYAGQLHHGGFSKLVSLILLNRLALISIHRQHKGASTILQLFDRIKSPPNQVG